MIKGGGDKISDVNRTDQPNYELRQYWPIRLRDTPVLLTFTVVDKKHGEPKKEELPGRTEESTG